MNVYGVLRLLVSKSPMPEPQMADCIAVIEEAERMNALGTSAKRMEVQAHECQYDYKSDVCRLCGKDRNE